MAANEKITKMVPKKEAETNTKKAGTPLTQEELELISVGEMIKGIELVKSKETEVKAWMHKYVEAKTHIGWDDEHHMFKCEFALIKKGIDVTSSLGQILFGQGFSFDTITDMQAGAINAISDTTHAMSMLIMQIASIRNPTLLSQSYAVGQIVMGDEKEFYSSSTKSVVDFMENNMNAIFNHAVKMEEIHKLIDDYAM